jgi:hypothetical protein
MLMWCALVMAVAGVLVFLVMVHGVNLDIKMLEAAAAGGGIGDAEYLASLRRARRNDTLTVAGFLLSCGVLLCVLLATDRMSARVLGVVALMLNAGLIRREHRQRRRRAQRIQHIEDHIVTQADVAGEAERALRRES